MADKQVRAVSVPAPDHDRPVRRQPPGNQAGQGPLPRSRSKGKAVDYDFTRDVGLIRIRPGPAAARLPGRAGTLGAPVAHEGPHGRLLGRARRDGLAHQSSSGRGSRTFLSGNPTYEAIECDVAPKQGRSGGGLFTTDGYIAGVCNFAEPQGNHGLYATPRSIYSLLDRNNLMALYAPVSRGSGTLVADGRCGCKAPREAPGVGRPFAVA